MQAFFRAKNGQSVQKCGSTFANSPHFQFTKQGTASQARITTSTSGATPSATRPITSLLKNLGSLSVGAHGPPTRVITLATALLDNEVTTYTLVHNLIRLFVLKASARQSVPVESVSFIFAVRYLAGLQGGNLLRLGKALAGRADRHKIGSPDPLQDGGILVDDRCGPLLRQFLDYRLGRGGGVARLGVGKAAKSRMNQQQGQYAGQGAHPER